AVPKHAHALAVEGLGDAVLTDARERHLEHSAHNGRSLLDHLEFAAARIEPKPVRGSGSEGSFGGPGALPVPCCLQPPRLGGTLLVRSDHHKQAFENTDGIGTHLFARVRLSILEG